MIPLRALAVLGAAGLPLLAAGGCKRASAPAVRVSVQQGRLRASFGPGMTAGAQGPEGRFAAGTSRGGVVFLRRDGEAPVRLLEDLGQRPRRRPEERGPAPASHDGRIDALEFSPDGRHLLSAGGHSAVYWDTERREMVRQVKGPYVVTAAAFDPEGKSVFFGTETGNVMRWSVDLPEAMGVHHFSCGATPVEPAQMALPPARRCPVGLYLEPPVGKPICAYRVTQLVRLGDTLARACREGMVGLLDLKTRGITWALAGALQTLTFVDKDQLVFGRDDGELRLYHARSQEVVRLLPGAEEQPPDAAASAAGLVAIAQRGRVRFFHAASGELSGAVTIPVRATWVSLSGTPLELTVLLEDGRLVVHSLSIDWGGKV
ncbi:MAG: hypothetical protein IT371_28220 [Deltaproteobacteria bacterium]|nr:hypothetical protein [Deltaproteobacteria bacterium]